jgi:hypothetical protein
LALWLKFALYVGTAVLRSTVERGVIAERNHDQQALTGWSRLCQVEPLLTQQPVNEEDYQAERRAGHSYPSNGDGGLALHTLLAGATGSFGHDGVYAV